MRYISKFDRFINEQEAPKPRKVIIKGEDKKVKAKFDKQKVGDNFPNRIPQGGTIEALYKSDAVKKSVQDLRPKIEQFIKDNPDESKFTLRILAGESQVTNPDKFKTPGSLALARANAVKEYVNEIFGDLIKSGKLVIAGPKSEADVTIGKTDYKGLTSQQRTANADAYRTEQFVDIDLEGSGEKIEKGKDIEKTFCGMELKSDGFALLPQDGYTYKQKVDLGPGEGKISITLDSKFVPDILYVEYNGKTYGEAILRGDKASLFPLAVGTAMLYAFKDNAGIAPSWGDKNTFKKLNPKNQDDYAKIIKGIKDMAVWGIVWKDDNQGTLPTGTEDDPKGNWGCFYNLFTHPDSTFKNQKISDAMANFDSRYRRMPARSMQQIEFYMDQYAKDLVDDLKKTDMKWGYVDSEMIQKGEYTIEVDKIDGVNELYVIDCAPCGSTYWDGKIDCK